ncbi:cation:proton antiporter [Virgisporangium aurantiacum]|uniref:Sodium/hydrogen exchanger n=1 Tax=Virgisporangium aurantiacum TaxID=175570 RepID=A0A8J4E6Z3_9ACTN|nr:sodium:proton antiporter [Virgisporangium aurantiacum]GIJ61332.1 sodium/hydrogen exchanger [Virgisporangium aurantiacum]
MSGLLLVLALGAIAVMAFGHRIGLQPGLAILVAAAGVSFIPGLPRWELEPELILGVVVPPLLYAAALEFSFFSFMRNLRSIIGLGVGLVVATAFLAGHAAAWVLPGLGVSVALVLGAIVGPPDTVTIASHGRELGLTRRVNALLTGESLVNDAAALTMFSVFVAGVAGTETFIDGPVQLFLYSVVVGVLIGMVLGFAATFVRPRLHEPTLETAIGLVLPFAAFFVAEHVHASGVLAVVMAGFSVSMNSVYSDGGFEGHRQEDLDDERYRKRLERRHRIARRLDYRTRLTEGAIWPVVNTLLEAFVFAYTGLQLRFVIEELVDSDEPLGRTLLAGTVILLVVIGIRVAYIMFLFRPSPRREARRARSRELRRKRRVERLMRAGQLRRAEQADQVESRPNRPLGWSEAFLLSWAGMRGIVTLGAAGGIPFALDDGTPFPHRSTIQFLAYFVVIGTLVVQGPTLPLFARWLRIDTTEEDAIAGSELAAARALADEKAPGGYDAQRDAVTMAVVNRVFDDEAARLVLADVDQQEAAAVSRARSTKPAE